MTWYIVRRGGSSWGEGRRGRYLDVSVGDAQAVAVVYGHDELLEDPARVVLTHEIDLCDLHRQAKLSAFLGIPMTSAGSTCPPRADSTVMP